MEIDLERRRLFKAVGAAGAAVIPLSALSQQSGSAPPAVAPSTPRTWLFFNPEEAAFVEAAIARLIPKDDSPGALEADVAWYIDGQLAGAWGNGLQLYAAGPFKQGTPGQGYQYPWAPAQLYRLAIKGVVAALGGKKLGDLGAEEQDAFLTRLDNGEVDIGPVPSKVFFELLWQNTQEGFFADPAYGGNKDMAGWKLIGFPGAYAAYAEWVDQYNVPFPKRPISMSEKAGHDMSQMEHGT